MNRLFRCARRDVHSGWWIVAPTPERAREVSLSHGYVRKAKNVTMIQDQTDAYLAAWTGPSLRLALESGEEGAAAFTSTGAWTVSDRSICHEFRHESVRPPTNSVQRLLGR